MGERNVVAEIETTREGDIDGWREWIVVLDGGGYVNIGREYKTPRGPRRPDPEAGIFVDKGAILDALVMSLQAAKLGGA